MIFRFWFFLKQKKKVLRKLNGVISGSVSRTRAPYRLHVGSFLLSLFFFLYRSVMLRNCFRINALGFGPKAHFYWAIFWIGFGPSFKT